MDDAVSRATNGHDAVEDMGSTTSLINRDLIRYARHIVLPGFGQEAQRRLRDSRVLVVGAGGLGSPVLLYLSAAGVGYLTILDDDVVDESNLQRQVNHRQADVGRPKALSAKDAVQRLNPHLVAEAVVARLGTDNALDLVKDHDLI
ncbi:MAG: HesA/MoeB/ThiF family protein, partial [Cutibacterium acnes]|nr:HesA/MoeB/ThiF family protein [Cutibacterium acnes]